MRCPRDAVPKREGKCEYDVYGGKADGAVSLTRTLDATARATSSRAASPSRTR